MTKLKQIITQDLKTSLYDFTHHFIYTIFIVSLASFATYFLIGVKIDKVINNITQQLQNKRTTTVVLPQPGDNLYVERASPYDNRTLEGTTPSANVIFHGPRDKKRIALTFDAEMTDGMKADLQSGKVKISYDRKIIN